jgi:hypothetical protein
LSTLEARLAEANVAAVFKPHPTVEVTADYRRTAPDLFLPRTSILSVFAQTSRHEAGAMVYLRPAVRVRFYGDYHVVDDDSGVGHRGGGKLTLSLGPGYDALVGTEVRVLHLASRGYTRGRLFVMKRVGAFSGTLDADLYRLEQAINGQHGSFTGAATIGWDFARGWHAVVTGIGDVTPLVERRFEVIAKLVYQRVFHVHEVHP